MMGIVMCGHLSKTELDAAALANTLLNAFGIGIGTGLSTACDTLFSQTYGSTKKKRMGMYLQRSFLIIALFPLFEWSLHINFEPILIALGQDPTIARLTRDYMTYFIPGTLFQHLYLVLARYLQNQEYVWAPMIIGLLANIFNVVSQYVAIYVWGYSYLASAVCESITFGLMFFGEAIFIFVTGMYRKTWDGWKREALFDWWHYLKLALPGIGMITLEVVIWESATFIAGYLGDVELGAQTIAYQVNGIIYMISMGIGVGVNIRVGQHFGAFRPQCARTSLNVGVCLALVCQLISVVGILSLHSYIPYIFTNDAEVVALTSSVLIIVGALQPFDGMVAILSGALRGAGRQIVGAGLVFIGLVLIGLPLIIVTMLVLRFSLYGCWTSVYFGAAVINVGYFILFWRIDWEKEAIQAQERIGDVGVVLPITEKSPLIAAEKAPVRRHPSNPTHTSSVVYYKMTERTKINKIDFAKQLVNRGVVYVVCIAIFVGAILVRIYTPDNHIVINVTNSSL